MTSRAFLVLCWLSALSASVASQAALDLHPQPSFPSLYQAPSSPDDTRHLFTHLPHGQVQLRNVAERPKEGDAIITVAVEASEPTSWYATLASITGLSLSETATDINEASSAQPTNASAVAYIVSMKSPTSLRHRQLLTEGIAHTGYTTLAYLPHNSFLVLPETADANETAFVEWTLSSAHVQRLQPYLAQNKIDPLISQQK